MNLSTAQKILIPVIVAIIASVGAIINEGIKSNSSYNNTMLIIHSTQTAEAAFTRATPFVTCEPGTPEAIVVTKEATVEVTRVITQIVTPTYTNAPKAYPLCTSVNKKPPCIHIASAEDSVSHLADSYYGDNCRSNIILNANRDMYGVYQGIMLGSKYLIPDPSATNFPASINQSGRMSAIPNCTFDPNTQNLISTLPCVYEIEETTPIYGLDYERVSQRIFKTTSQSDRIMNANIQSGCNVYGIPGGSIYPIELEPGVRIVIPTRLEE
jgi:hypothetical protein